jgi:lipopolysaccharide biosynthesis glycosyltransferase
VNIVCAIDDGYAQHCGVMLRSLFANNPGTAFRVFVLTDGLRESTRARLDAVARASGQSLECRVLDRAMLGDAPVNGHVSLATYFRVLIPNLLPPEVGTVLFLDADLIVRGQIGELCAQRIDGYPVAAVANPFGDGEMDRLGIHRQFGYFNAGVLLMNLRTWREEDLSRRVLHCIATSGERLLWWDQDALNLALQGRWLRCHPMWNAQEAFFRDHPLSALGITADELRETRAAPRIVHFAGSWKPWHYGYEHPFKREYYRYLAETPWKGTPPVDMPPVRVRARLLAARMAPPLLRRGYQRLAAAFRPRIGAA